MGSVAGSPHFLLLLGGVGGLARDLALGRFCLAESAELESCLMAETGIGGAKMGTAVATPVVVFLEDELLLLLSAMLLLHKLALPRGALPWSYSYNCCSGLVFVLCTV